MVPPAADVVEQARWHVSAIEQVDRALSGGPPIAVLCWPEDATTVRHLEQLGVPRLLLLPPDAEACPAVDDLEDWVRLPATDSDIKARLAPLRRRALSRPVRPMLDGSGRLVYDGQWVGLTMVEERMAVPLVEHFNEIVADDVLMAAAWPGAATPRSTLRPRITRLRRRVREIGLDIATVRSEGYSLRRCQSKDSAATITADIR
jgi:hypothetical protein